MTLEYKDFRKAEVVAKTQFLFPQISAISLNIKAFAVHYAPGHVLKG